MKNITGYLIDPAKATAKVVTIEKSLDSYYKLLGCRCIDIVRRRIGFRSRKYFDIICDDEGALVDDPRISAVDNLGRTMLVGAILVTKFDGGEDITSLDDQDIAHISNFIQMQGTRRHQDPYPMLMQCEY